MGNLVGNTMRAKADRLFQSLQRDPILSKLPFEPVTVAGIAAFVARRLLPSGASRLWRRAKKLCPTGYSPILTDDDCVHPDIEALPPLAEVSLAEARRTRERLVAANRESARALNAIGEAMPQAETCEERDCFYEDPFVRTISLVLVEGPAFLACLPFTPDGEGTGPHHAELAAMLEHWRRHYGAVPFYADGDLLELDVPFPPAGLAELRELARDFFLLSQGNREGFGLENPARLLRRLTGRRWVVWWYGP